MAAFHSNKWLTIYGVVYLVDCRHIIHLFLFINNAQCKTRASDLHNMNGFDKRYICILFLYFIHSNL